MARDEPARERTTTEPILDRRSYLKLTGAAASAAAATGLVGKVNAASYRTITVPAGATRDINIGSGETFEDVLIDMTANDASARILTSGEGWTIRNVGFKGNHPGGHFLINPGVSTTDGHALVENVYMGDGQTEGSASGAIWLNSNLPHRGTITFRNIHVAHCANNGLYGSGPGTKDLAGNCHVEDSFFYSNNISNIRLNGYGRTCFVRNCTVKVDDSTPACGANCSDPGAVVNRGVWAWYGRAHLVDSDIQGSLVTTNGGEITQENTRLGSAADTTPPDGAPMSAEEAASGSASGGSGGSGDDGTTDGSDFPNTLSIVGDESVVGEYTFTVSGDLKKSTARNASKDGADVIDGSTASGSVLGGVDSYAFSGDITDFTLDGTATLYLNGNQVLPSNLGSDSDPALPNTIIVDGSNRPRRASKYEFTVSGDIQKAADLGTVNAHDEISGGTATGRIIGGKDGYRFSGEVTSFRLAGPATVTVQDGSN